MERGTITFRTRVQKALWDYEITGQISDGHWENAGPHNHWEFWGTLESKVGTDVGVVRGDKPCLRYAYDLANENLFDVVGDRMLLIAKAAKLGWPEEMIRAAEYFEGETAETAKPKKGLTAENIQELFACDYTAEAVKRDLKEMSDVMKTASYSGKRKLEDKKEKASEKDLMRVRDIVTKAKGDKEKEVQLAMAMAKSIATYSKATGRRDAALELDLPHIAKVFDDKAKSMNESKSYKYVKLYETFQDDKTEGALNQEREDLIRRGEFKIYIGSEENVRKFFSNLTSEAAPYAKMLSDKNDKEVRILFPKDMDIVFELKDVADTCNLVPLDVNSVKIEESLSASKKITKKEEKDLLELAKDSSKQDSDFAVEFDQCYNTAIDVWMGEDQLKKLRNMYKTSKYVFMSLGGESENGSDDSKMESYLKKGWKLFDDEQNFENYDSILYKKI